MARVKLNTTQNYETARRKSLLLVNRYGHEVLDGARRLVPDGDHMSGSGKQKPGPTLEQSLYFNISPGGYVVKARVGSRKKYAATVHSGSSAHIIRGRKGKMLKFRWERGDFLVAARAGRRRGNRRTGQFHYFLRVRHPGNKRPVRFLTTPLAMFGRVHGFRVSTSPVSVSRLP